MDIISGGISIFILYWCILFDIVPKAPVTTGMTTTLILETFCNSVIKPWYLSIFFCYLTALVNFFLLFKGYILVPRNYKSNNLTLSLFCLLIQTMSGNLHSMALSVWILKSQRILYLSIPWTDWCVCVCVYVRTTCHRIVSDVSYTAASAHRPQLCHGVFYIDF